MNHVFLVALLIAAAIALYPARGQRYLGAQIGSATPTSTLSLHRRVRDRVARMMARPEREIEAALLPVTEALGGALRAGLAPGPAVELASVGVKGPLGEALAGVERRARMGEGLAAGWAEAADRLDSDEMRMLARAWSLSEETGTALADAAATTARVLRDEREQRDQTRAAIAAARTTMTILTLLPVGGPLLSVMMGVDLHRLFLESALVWACFGLGGVLVILGRWWVAKLIDASLKGPMLR